MAVSSPGPIGLLWRHRSLLLRTTRSDLLTRYAGSAFGRLWLLLQPLLLLTAYATFQLATRTAAADQDAVAAILLIFSGLIPFLGFAEALSGGTSSVTGNSSLLKNTLFPIDLVPVKAVLSGQATQLVGMAILLGALLVTGRPSWWWLLVPCVWVLQIALSCGLVWILSAANVFLRDLQQIVGVLILVLMMVSPIGFKADSPAADAMRPALVINPLSYLMGCYQDCLVLDRFPVRNNFWVLLVMAPVVFFAGHWCFARLKQVMADHV